MAWTDPSGPLPIRAYIAHAMTGRSGTEMWDETLKARYILGGYGVETLDPVEAEGVSSNVDTLAPDDDLIHHWRRDKELIRKAHVLIDLTPHIKSEGVSHEIGYARYHLWMPVFRVVGDSQYTARSIARFEDDFIVQSLHDAGRIIQERFGTRWKRVCWRFAIYGKYWRKGFWHKLGKWVI